MKKSIIAAIVAAPLFITSCGLGSQSPNLKTDIDTVSYELGMTNTNGIDMYFQQTGIDSTNINDFLKGVKDGALSGDDKQKKAYYAGIQIGQQMTSQMLPGIENHIFCGDSTKKLSLKNFLAGFYSGVKHEDFTIDTITYNTQNVGRDLQMRIEELRRISSEKMYSENKKASEEFVAKKAKEEGYKQLDGGVLYKVITEGKGATPKDGDAVKVQYEGKLIDGNVFDKTEEGKAADMTVGRLVPGFNTALKAMPVGSKWEIILPYDQAYGEMQAGKIKPYSALIFTVQLEKIGK